MSALPLVVCHGGTDSKPQHADGCQAACRAGLAAIARGGDALEAAVAAVSVLEEDGRFGAGLGAPLGMDGRTIQMDAGVMDSLGRLGAVASIEHVVHPVQVARHVADTPHHLLVSEGAIDFARRCGLLREFEPNQKVLDEFRHYVELLARAPDDAQGDDAPDTEGDPGRALVKRFWNYPVPWQQVMDEFGHGTVGAVARDVKGRLAVAVSTGGSMPALRGRVADIGVPGCGFYAGPVAAIAVSGIGEHSLRQRLARTVYRWIADGLPLADALEQGVAMIPEPLQSALIGITPTAAQVASRRPFAHAMLGGDAG